MLHHEEAKYSRYPLHVNGQRVTSAVFVPAVVSALGGVGPKFAEYLHNLEADGRERGRTAFAGGLSLVDFMSLHGVMLCADRIRRTFCAERPAAAGTEGVQA